jgi:hypothetical protein
MFALRSGADCIDTRWMDEVCMLIITEGRN